MIEFLGLWERLHNLDFKPLEFEGLKKQVGANAFTMSPNKWIDSTNTVGIVSKAGCYGGMYAHSDIAMSFATWISPELTPAQVAYTYANEADMLNVVLFGKIAKQWKDENPTSKGNMRDTATLNQLLVLANLESYNAVLINQGKKQKERMELLRQLAVQQLQTLETISLNNLPRLKVEEK